jgi:hypothetical protein
LLHFIVQEIEKDHAELLKFGDEFQGVAEVASKSKSSFISNSRCNAMEFIVNSAQTDIDNAKNMSIESMPGDRFVNAMEVIISISTTNISIDR